MHFVILVKTWASICLIKSFPYQRKKLFDAHLFARVIRVLVPHRQSTTDFGIKFLLQRLLLKN